jgi:hypothetical protein
MPAHTLAAGMSRRAVRRGPLGVGLAAVLAVLVATAPATTHAQPSASQRETARALMKQGDERFAAADFAHALPAYQAAHALVGVPTTGIAVALTHEKLGHLVEARDAAIEVMRMPAQPREPAPLTEARQRAAELANAVAPRIPSLTIRVDVPRTGASVVLDGKPIASVAVGAPWKLDPGPHVVRVSAPGHTTAEKMVTLAEAASVLVEISLIPDAARVAPPQARDTTRVSPVAYVAFAVGGAALVGGAVTGGLAWSQTADLEDRCAGGCPAELAGDLDRARTLATTSNVLFAVAATGAVVGVGALLFLGAPDRRPGAAFRGRPGTIRF